MTLTNWNGFLTRELTGGKKTYFESISLKQSLKDYSIVIVLDKT